MAACVALAIACLTGFVSSSINIDPHYTGSSINLDSFDSIRADYPDADMSDHIGVLATEEQLNGLDLPYSGLTLYYKQNKAWDNPKYWYSIHLYGVSNPDDDGIYQQVSLYCMFTGTISEWMAASADEVSITTVGNTEVTLETNNCTECRYAYFETGNVIYELRVQHGDSAAKLQTILDILLL
ncbi:MAG: hypothetical protein LUE27_10505 [Clostridia bacterium]|nr:hypothetical protein [Clostridia bacterium]